MCKYVGNSLLDTPIRMLRSYFPFTVVAVFMGVSRASNCFIFYLRAIMPSLFFLFFFLGFIPSLRVMRRG